MTSAYRDENATLRATNEQLVRELAARDAELADLRRRRTDQEAVFARLEGALAARRATASRAVPLLLLVGGVVLGVGAVSLRGFAGGPRPAPPLASPPPTPQATPAPGARTDPCATSGVHLTVAGEDAEAPAANARDLAGQKYRKGGDRAPWFTVQGGPLYVHAVGDAMAQDVGVTRLSLLDIRTQGEPMAYRLARDGRSFLEIERADDGKLVGRFEADVSKVEDTTREPPFGTPVVRARGTFCLPRLPANPKDTGP
jgi:hypothetical protein